MSEIKKPVQGKKPVSGGVRHVSSSSVHNVRQTRPAPAKHSVTSVKSSKSVKRNHLRRKTVFGFDAEALLTLALIVVLLAGIIALAVLGTKRCANNCTACSSTRELPVNASIRSEEEIAAAKAAASQTPAPTEVPAVSETAPAVTEATAQPTEQPTESVVLPAATAAATVRSSGELRSATIRTAGDFVIHVPIIDSSKALGKQPGAKATYDFYPMLDMVASTLANADFSVTNVDGSMGGKYKYGYTGYPQFNTPPHLMYALVDCGIDMLTLANNHMLDGWYDGLLYEIDNVESLGLKHVGAYRSQEDRNTPVIYEINGIKVGFMNYTYSLNSMESRGVDQKALDYGAGWTKNSSCKADAKALRNAGADVIVCYMHWGTEYDQNPDNNQKYIAKMLVESGVDVIMGGHPHVVQPAVWMSGTNQFGEAQDTLCVYSVGNFLSDQRESPKDGGIIFDFTIQENADGSFSITNPSYLPIWVWRTGSEGIGYTYEVVPIGKYLKSRPAGMSDSDYNTMMKSYNNSVSVMGQGIGTLISE